MVAATGSINIVQDVENKLVRFEDSEGNAIMEIGRGTTDADATFIALYNTDGEKAYVLPNATQDGITVQSGRP